MLNVVTVPMGAQIGTDSGAGEGKGDHTEWGVLYDHRSNALYWRTQFNQNYQRLRLADLPSLTAQTLKALLKRLPRKHPECRT